MTGTNAFFFYISQIIDLEINTHNNRLFSGPFIFFFLIFGSFFAANCSICKYLLTEQNTRGGD